MDNPEIFSISLIEYRGEKISPNNIPIALLDSYFADLKKFIIGDTNEKDISIKISKGSLKTIILASAIFISGLIADVEAIQSGTISSYNSRAKAAKSLQSYVKRNNAQIIIGIDSMQTPLILSPQTDILKLEDLWADIETYAFGTIRDMGGADPNLHLIDESGAEIKISATKENLTALKYNVLYSQKLIHFRAKKNLLTGEIKNRELIGIEDLPKFDKDYFAKKIKITTEEWRGIDVKSFIDDIRGYNEKE